MGVWPRHNDAVICRTWWLSTIRSRAEARWATTSSTTSTRSTMPSPPCELPPWRCFAASPVRSAVYTLVDVSLPHTGADESSSYTGTTLCLALVGGGMGLTINSKYRIATESTMCAMPETGIISHWVGPPPLRFERLIGSSARVCAVV